MAIVAPSLNGSVLEALIKIVAEVGSASELNWTSKGPRSVVGSKEAEVVNSLTPKNPKKAVRVAAQNRRSL